jgi:hypothetical protein
VPAVTVNVTTTCWAGGAGGSSSFAGGGGGSGICTVVYGGGGSGGEYAAEPGMTGFTAAAEGMRRLAGDMTAASVSAAALWPPQLPPPTPYAAARMAWEETGDLDTLLDLLTVINAATGDEDLR